MCPTPLFCILVDLVDMSTGGRVVVGGRVLVVWGRALAGGGGTRQEGRTWDWPAGQPILTKPAPSFFTCSPVAHQPPCSDPPGQPLELQGPCKPPCPAGMHLWPSEAAVWVVQLLSGRAVFHE